MKKLTSIFIYLLLVIPSQAGTIYVDVNATGANNGTSWADAYKYLQDALTAAEPNHEIRVAQGTYKPDKYTAYPGGTFDRTATFQLKNGVAIYGGYPHGGRSRDPNIYQTILSGDIGVEGNNSDNSCHVVTGYGTNSSAILDGFTIIAGNATGSYPHNCGGGMYNYSGNPTVTNCTFSGNSAEEGGGMDNRSNSSPTVTNCTFNSNYSGGNGGGMFNFYYSSPTLTNCTFTGNSAEFYGGGMCNDESSTTVTNCTFSGNSAQTDGGGMFNDNESSPILNNCTFSGNSGWFGGGMGNYSSDPNLTNCTFSGNSAGYCGGGMYNYSGSPTVTNCTFSGNSATYYGGGIRNDSSSPTLTNCTFSGNSAVIHGGGMCNDESSTTATNCTFIGNSASSQGGGMRNYFSSPTLTNCTFTGNSAQNGGGMSNYSSSYPTVTNCILWGNTAQTGPQIYNDTSSPAISFSDVQGGLAGTGNINEDPLFIDANGPDNIFGTADDNLRLSYGSPCVDKGNNASVPTGIVTDLDGRDRFADGDCNDTDIVDMGAYEFTYAYFGDFDSDCHVDFIDFAIQADFWLTNEFLVDIAPTPAGDGIVDTSDLAVLCDNWLESF